MKFKLTRFVLSLIFGTILLSQAGGGYAQTDQPTGPVYIVQQGDTLTTIAFQFGVTVDDLLTANGLSRDSILFVGDSIIIPGLEGVTGVLETQTIPFGENLRSLSRRYQIPVDKLVKLNRLVSPAELYAGSSLILPVSTEGLPETSRTILAPGQSLLELAVVENVNPWKMTGYNRLSGQSRVVPGDILFVPEKTLSGPGAFPAPITGVEINNFYQGETAVIHIQGSEGMSFQGKLNNRVFDFYWTADGDYAGMQGIHALADPGLYSLSITGNLANGATFTHHQMVLVRPRGYLFENVTVPPALIDPETTQQEEDFVRPLVNVFTPVKMWEGVFLPPSIYSEYINSSFGNRRSYNGSAYTYFHGGVDFAGGTGVEIMAPAKGVVIFADLLEVRGNFTLIDHGWGVLSAYMHQSEIFVKAGETVEPGQVIGLVGSTGRSTGAHLHWEIWVGGVQVNPLDWLEIVYP